MGKPPHRQNCGQTVGAPPKISYSGLRLIGYMNTMIRVNFSAHQQITNAAIVADRFRYFEVCIA